MLTAPPCALAVSANNPEKASVHREGMNGAGTENLWLHPGANLTHRACVQNTPRGTGGFQQSHSKQICPKQAVGQGLLCKLQHASTLVQEVAHTFQNLLALVLNLSYEEEGLEYCRIYSKILTILSSFLKTSQQQIQVANTPTRLCTKVRIETITVFTS